MDNPAPMPETAQNLPSEPICAVRVFEDAMAVYLNAVVPKEGIGDLMVRAQDALENAGIRRPDLISHALDRMVSASEHDSLLKDLLLLEGVPPKPPRDAQVEWLGNFFKEGFEIDPVTGAVDYRKRLANRSATEGQPLAKTLPPLPGENGYNVFGEILRPPPPAPLKIRCGANVIFNSAENLFTATASGRISLKNDTLSVDEILVVEANVDLSTGDINHPGVLIVNKDIRSGATVTAGGDLEVHGFIEDAHISVGGNLFVKAAISQSHLDVKGEVHANLVENSTIHAQGDIYIAREIMQSEVLTRGAVISPGARVVGGKLQALRGIEVAELGSNACVRTEVVCGEDYTLEERAQAAEAEIKLEQETLRKIAERVTPLRNKGKDLPPKAREALTLLLDEEGKLDRNIHSIEDDIERMRKEVRGIARTDIRLKRALHTETRLRMRGVTFCVPKNLSGATFIGLSQKGIMINSKPAAESFLSANL